MKIFLSALENNNGTECIVQRIGQLRWNLCSYYYIRKHMAEYELILRHSENTMVDSGAHSFQYGIKVDWEKYTHEYAEFIKKYDCDKTLGYFEMDADNIIGYENVLKLRAVLERVSNKIIPVWHKNRGIEEYEKMCRDYSGRIIGITGFKNMDIRDEQYPLFLKKAWDHNCKVHCLGMTRKEILDKVPFDYVDSSSWVMSAVNGRIMGKKITRQFYKKRDELFITLTWVGWKCKIIIITNGGGSMEIRKMTRQAIVAAVYVAISLLLAPISYGAVQLRLAETLKVLPYYNRRHTVGVTLGCLIVNMFSPMGIADVVFGTLATFITCELASRVKRTIYIAPVTAIVTGIIVGAELHVVLGLPFLPSVITVTAGEFLAVLIGVVIAGALNKNDAVGALLHNG